MGIASSVLEAIEGERKRYPGQRVAKVGLDIGEFSGVDTESLRFCFDVICKHAELAPIELELTWCTVEAGRSGEELDLAYLELV